MPYEKSINVCLDAKLYEKLRVIAEAENRTLSGQARFWLRLAIEAYEKTKK